MRIVEKVIIGFMSLLTIGLLAIVAFFSYQILFPMSPQNVMDDDYRSAEWSYDNEPGLLLEKYEGDIRLDDPPYDDEWNNETTTTPYRDGGKFGI